jgi:BioD-like phosphotransacetylase family protein
MKVVCKNKPDFNLIAQTLSYLLSQQLDAEIVITMTPKDDEGGEVARG